MRKIVLLSLLFLCCGAKKPSEECRNGLVEMKKELAQAQKKLQQQQAYVERLEEEIARCEIVLIQQEISHVNKYENAKQILSDDETLAFFRQQRETLNRIIWNNPSCRREAQTVLDEILTLITQLGDAAKD